MQTGPIVIRCLYELQQSRKGPLLLHQLESLVVGSAVKQEESSHNMEGSSVLFLGVLLFNDCGLCATLLPYLEYAIYKLSADILLIGLEDGGVQELVATSC